MCKEKLIILKDSLEGKATIVSNTLQIAPINNTKMVTMAIKMVPSLSEHNENIERDDFNK